MLLKLFKVVAVRRPVVEKKDFAINCKEKIHGNVLRLESMP